MIVLAGVIVVASGLFLVGLGLLIVIRPERGRHFLSLVASSARAHYAEQSLRLVAGAALVVYSPSMWYAGVFNLLGWLVVGTAGVLIFIPWRWHDRFARWVRPMVFRYLTLYGLAAFLLGSVLLYALFRAVPSV